MFGANGGTSQNIGQCQRSHHDVYGSTTSWPEIANAAWLNGMNHLSPQSLMPPSPMSYPGAAHVESQHSPYKSQTLYLGAPDTSTINPIQLQIPNTVGQADPVSPYNNMLPGHLGNNGVSNFGFPGSPLQLSPDDFADNNAVLPEGYLEVMRNGPVPEMVDFSSAFDDLATAPSLTDDAMNMKKPHTRLSDHQTITLRNWFYLHIDDPYPSNEEIAELQNETQLTVEQVRNWFSRSRQRMLPDRNQSPARSSSNEMIRHDGTVPEGTAHSPLGYLESQHHSHGQPVPLDTPSVGIQDQQSNGARNRPHRHRAPTITIDTSHLELTDEGAPQVADCQIQTPIQGGSPIGLVPDISDAGSEYAMSVVSRRSSVRSHSSYRSARSHQSNHSGSSVGVRGSRRGRRRVTSVSRSPSEASSCRELLESPNGLVTHPCHLCHETFNRKSTVTRHINTIHGKEKRPWICSLTGFTQCLFCSLTGTVEDCPHRISVCENKHQDDRSYWRKDHFMQHLEGVHKVSKSFVRQFGINLDRWRAPKEGLAVDEDDMQYTDDEVWQ